MLFKSNSSVNTFLNNLVIIKEIAEEFFLPSEITNHATDILGICSNYVFLLFVSNHAEY